MTKNNNKNNQFPINFLFGVATSAEQSEGKISFPHSITNWDLLYQQNKSQFFNNIGPNITNNISVKYKEDLSTLASIGINSYRTSFSWAKIFTSENCINKDAIDFYHNYIDEMIKNNLKVFMCLNHFDLPKWFVDKGGFENSDNAKYFLEFSKLILNEFGHKINYLSTFNEPSVPIYCGYWGKYHFPQVIDNKRAFQAAYGTILCHSLVVNYFNKEYKKINDIKIGVIFSIAPALPKDNFNYSMEDEKAAEIYNLIHNYAMLDAMVKGHFSNELISFLNKENLMPLFQDDELKIISQNKLDFIGINYYFPSRVKAPTIILDGAWDNHIPILEKYTSVYNWDKAIMNKSRGWEILPSMISVISNIIKTRYDNIPCYISENGIGIENEYNYKKDNIIEDWYRCAFINEHLSVLLNEINQNKLNCFGYHIWTGIDCWSWLNAYKNRYGIIELNLLTEERIFKRSAYWFKQLIKNNCLDDSLNRIETYLND